MNQLEMKRARVLDERALATLFTEARTASGFLPDPVSRETLERVLELALLGPTSANMQPLRVVFCASAAGKERLLPALSPGNVEKTQAAPVTAIFAADTRFYEHGPRLYPAAPQFKNGFEGPENVERATQFALTNATLQAAYFLLAARALGLDVGPMGGFDKIKVDAEFFGDGRFKAIFLANVGYADDTKVRPRNPRFTFSEVASIV